MALTSELLSPEIFAATEALSNQSDNDSRGAIYTRLEVVEFILDLVGYTADKPLHQARILEPSFGGGDFILPIAKRLLDSWSKAQGANSKNLDEALKDCIRAVELHRKTFETTKENLILMMMNNGLERTVAQTLANSWLVQADFLCTHLDDGFDYVVGNPPYVRQEMIPPALLKEYKRRYFTIYDRADLYIPFIERSLRLLSPGGQLGFICADRWMKNKYGGPLRNIVANEYHLRIYVDMVNTAAFHSEVTAYPAITVISRENKGPTRIAHRPPIDKTFLASLAKSLTAPKLCPESSEVRELSHVTHRDEPWLLESADQMSLLRRIESQFPLIEEVGCKVGIGIATGADKAFIGQFDSLAHEVEPSRLVPLVTTKDIMSGEVVWLGKGVINTYSDAGKPVDLSEYPKLRGYLMARHTLIAKRHCAVKSPASWFRTIDRINLSILNRPKLLIPDIKGESHIVYEEGKLYPHHNLYYVVSDVWDLRALQAVLLSSVSRLFIATYSTKMRGGCLRFQAQYLRRLRLPLWSNVPDSLRHELADAAISRDIRKCDIAAFKLYRLNPNERSCLGGNGD